MQTARSDGGDQEAALWTKYGYFLGPPLRTFWLVVAGEDLALVGRFAGIAREWCEAPSSFKCLSCPFGGNSAMSQFGSSLTLHFSNFH